jgi:hypothetical protein
LTSVNGRNLVARRGEQVGDARRRQPTRPEQCVDGAVLHAVDGLGEIQSLGSWARWWLLATLLAVYPANINMAVSSCSRGPWRGTRKRCARLQIFGV